LKARLIQDFSFLFFPFMSQTTERLIIENFAGITHLEIDVRPFTILIGPQSVGKSVTAKLLHFIRRLPKQLGETVFFASLNNREIFDVWESCRRAFEKAFPSSVAKYTSQSRIIYESGTMTLTIRFPDGNVLFDAPETLFPAVEKFRKQLASIAEAKESLPHVLTEEEKTRAERIPAWFHYEQTMDSAGAYEFVPAGRSFYGQIERDFASYFANAAIDPFMEGFAKSLAVVRQVHSSGIDSVEEGLFGQKVTRLLGGHYVRENNEDVILAQDGRHILSRYWSSGQQEVQPLLAILRYYIDAEKKVWSIKHLFIEEPEAHLFPRSQRTIMELIATVFNRQRQNMRVFLTTHSPYIPGSVNNLLQAGLLYADIKAGRPGLGDDKKDALAKIVPEEEALPPGSVGAFYMTRDECRSIIDPDSGLINAEAIDDISIDIGRDFDEMLNLAPTL
jgi:ABC-type cobalamin/Fe3+-siderophores transport system ATPase subunit